MFQGDFYQITSGPDLLGQEHSFRIRLNEDHEIFKAHFPGQPITPGVVQLEMVKELTGIVLGSQVSLVSIHRCKYLNILDPRTFQEIFIKLQIQEIEGIIKVNATISAGETIFLKLSSKYR